MFHCIENRQMLTKMQLNVKDCKFIYLTLVAIESIQHRCKTQAQMNREERRAHRVLRCLLILQVKQLPMSQILQRLACPNLLTNAIL